MRGCSLLDDSMVDFERFVDLMLGKKFKVVRPGNSGGATSVTPEVFILQVDLLTSCMTADDRVRKVVNEERKGGPEEK